MSTTRLKDRKKFLDYLRRSKLLSPEQYEEVLARLPDTDRASVVGRLLVEWGLLTKFQAEMLLAGRNSGFVLGQYRILDQIGRGGMGRVFKAMHQTMHRVVALKVLSNELLKNDKAQQLFQREVRALARLIHPNIVTAYDANQLGERYYMVMEYVDGPNLEQLVRDKGPLPVGQACDFIRQAAIGLQFAFDKGMVHRDIKPANLLVQGADGDDGCVVKILDFGLARLHPPVEANEPADGSILIERNAVVGTPDYVSPEQARNLHQADIRSDLYSLGCTLYFLLTGKAPYGGASILEKLVRHTTQPVPEVERVRSDVPPAVGAVIRRLLAKKPDDRFQTPAELAEALAPFSVDEPPSWEAEREPATPLVTPTNNLLDAPAGVTDEDPLAPTLPASTTTVPETELDIPWTPYQFAKSKTQLRSTYILIAIGCGIFVGLIGILIAILAS
jgi:serine/threonine protein kinase